MCSEEEVSGSGSESWDRTANSGSESESNDSNSSISDLDTGHRGKGKTTGKRQLTHAKKGSSGASPSPKSRKINAKADKSGGSITRRDYDKSKVCDTLCNLKLS